MSQALERVAQALRPRVLDFSQYQGEVSVRVTREQLLEFMTSLKQDYGFDYLTDIGTLDHYSDQGRFEVFYNVINLTESIRLRVKCRVEEADAWVPTVTGLWPSAAWHEREAYDMMGIRFEGHPDMRRMYMPEDFQYFPLRKEFPLIGIPGSIQVPEKDTPKGYR